LWSQKGCVHPVRRAPGAAGVSHPGRGIPTPRWWPHDNLGIPAHLGISPIAEQKRPAVKGAVNVERPQRSEDERR